MAEPEQAEHAVSSGVGDYEDWKVLLEGAQTGTLPGAAVREAARRFWLQWMAGEGLLTCPYCGVEFKGPEELAEHERWECE